MDFFEGYNYRINIVGADSSIIVDSNTGLIKGCIADVDENIIVDIFNSTFYGTLIGNIIDKDLNLVLDINQKTITVKSLISENIKGNIVNNDDELIFDSFHNTISNIEVLNANVINANSIITNNLSFDTIRGSIVNINDQIIFDYFHNAIENLDVITAGTINADIVYGNLIGDIKSKNNNIIIDHSNNKIYVSSIESINEKNIDFGTAHLPIDFSFYINSRLTVNSVIKSLNEPQTMISVKYQRDSLDSPENVRGGDVAGLFSADAYYNYSYKPVGAMGFIIDPELKEDEEINVIPSYFIVIPHSRELDMNLAAHEINIEHPVFKESLTFGMGVLSAPVFKLGVHENQNKIKAEKGMIMFNNEIGKFQGYTGTEWVNLH